MAIPRMIPHLELKHGGKTVRFHIRPIVTCLAIIALLGTAGCGGGDAKRSETAAVGAPKDDNSQPGAGTPEAAARPPAYDPKHPVVAIETSMGSITVSLDAEKAPLTVNNFLSYVNSGHYDQTIFHQVLSDQPQVVLGGAFTAKLVEKMTETAIRNEAHNGLENLRGTIAMARRADSIDSATCHFFFNVSDNRVLDHKNRTLEGYGYCVFGKIIAGLDIVDKIAKVKVRDTNQFERIPVETVMIKSVRRVR